MSVRLTCPACGCQGDAEAFLVEDEAKRFAARFAAMEPALGRAVLGYLRLFKPARQALRLARAAKLVEELVELIEPGTVCRDERNGARRAAPEALWAAGMEQMLVSPPSGLPLANHHYLRAVVWGLADEAAAAAERKVEEDRKAGRHRAPTKAEPEDKAAARRAFARQMVDLGTWTQEQADEYLQG